jgi:NADH-quinone oxidoreductase subunit E
MMVMCLKAILVTGGVFGGLSIMLLIAQRYLVISKPCTITVNGGEESFDTQGGISNLLTVLTDNGMTIPAACGGKGMCGYCKVRVVNGGGPLLPTELPFLSRTEVRSNVRLSCQVKVKDDMEVQVPDFLETVRDMVKNLTFDASLRWRFALNNEPEDIEIEEVESDLSPEDEATMIRIIEEHQSTSGSTVPILQEINKTFKYLPEPVIRYTARKLDMPMSELYRIATFYNAFSLTPKGRNVIKICLGTACYVKRGQKLLETIERQLGIKLDDRTEDGKFSIEAVSCVGCCGQSPCVVVNETIFGYVKPDMIEGILAQFS